MKDFNEIAKDIKALSTWRDPLAFSIARITPNDDGKTLCANFGVINYKSSFVSAGVIINALMKNGVSFDFSQSEVVALLEKYIKRCLTSF